MSAARRRLTGGYGEGVLKELKLEFDPGAITGPSRVLRGVNKLRHTDERNGTEKRIRYSYWKKIHIAKVSVMFVFEYYYNVVVPARPDGNIID